MNRQNWIAALHTALRVVGALRSQGTEAGHTESIPAPISGPATEYADAEVLARHALTEWYRSPE